jgi:hypothetical protein
MSRPSPARARRVARLLLIPAVFLASGCATQAAYPGDRSSHSAVVVVNNTNTSLSSITVWLLAPGGERQKLGTVNLNETRSFPVRRAAVAGTYRLRAEPLGDRDFTSNSFSLRDGDTVEWNLRRNYVQFRGNEPAF